MISKWTCSICDRKFEKLIVSQFNEESQMLDVTEDVIDHLCMHINQLIIAVNKNE